MGWRGTGLLGSTEWVEQHVGELQEKAVAYINTDGNSRGFLGMSGSHVLEQFINRVARDIEDPETKTSVWKRAQARAIATSPAATRAERAAVRICGLARSARGPTIQRSCSMRHRVVEPRLRRAVAVDGVYHSIYDDFYYFSTFIDPDFAYGRALAQTVGTAVIRLADAELLPVDFTNLADTVPDLCSGTAGRCCGRQQDEVRERNRQIEEGVFAAISNPSRPFKPPVAEAIAPALNFAPLENAGRCADRRRRAIQEGRGRVTG
jgi:N-acetylated-alpha-linked acidic dipeptidase